MNEEGEKKSAQGWWRSLGAKDRRLLLKLAACLILGAALMVWGRSQPSRSPAPPPEPAAPTINGDELEMRLTAALSQVKGAGEVRVLITYEESAAAVYATESQSSTRTDQQDLEQSLAVVGDGPVLVKEKGAQARGVLVVSVGAGDPLVRERLYTAVKSLLGISGDQIAIIEGE